MPEIKAYAPGIYARSEALVQATRDLDRGRAAGEAVVKQQNEDLHGFLEVQRKAGLDYLSDGLLNWQDVFRPFDAAARGLRPGPLTRFLNTNTFFKAPVARGWRSGTGRASGRDLFSVLRSYRGADGWRRCPRRTRWPLLRRTNSNRGQWPKR